jgi:hypothetical protein
VFAFITLAAKRKMRNFMVAFSSCVAVVGQFIVLNLDAFYFVDDAFSVEHS